MSAEHTATAHRHQTAARDDDASSQTRCPSHHDAKCCCPTCAGTTGFAPAGSHLPDARAARLASPAPVRDDLRRDGITAGLLCEPPIVA